MESRKPKVIRINNAKKVEAETEVKPLGKIIEKRVNDIYFDSLKEIDDLLNDKM